jgi:hypothetical protein
MSDDKIYNLFGGPIGGNEDGDEIQEPCPEVIELLETILEGAKSGAVQSLSAVWVHGSSYRSTEVHRACIPSTVYSAQQLIIGNSLLNRRLEDLLLDMESPAEYDA